MRPRSALSRTTVERALRQGGSAALKKVVQTDLARADGEATGLHLVARARRPA